MTELGARNQNMAQKKYGIYFSQQIPVLVLLWDYHHPCIAVWLQTIFPGTALGLASLEPAILLGPTCWQSDVTIVLTVRCFLVLVSVCFTMCAVVPPVTVNFMLQELCLVHAPQYKDCWMNDKKQQQRQVWSLTLWQAIHQASYLSFYLNLTTTL